MENLVNTDYYGLIVLEKPIKFDDLTVYGCLYNETTDLKEMHRFFCFLIARKSFLLNGGKIEDDTWYNSERDLTFICGEEMVKLFEYLFGRYKTSMIELPPHENISFQFGEVEMENVIIKKELIERYQNIISGDGKK